MRKRLSVLAVIGAGLLLAATTYADPYNPGERAIPGELLRAGTGAVIGSIAGDGHGAGIGAAVGGGLGGVAGDHNTSATAAAGNKRPYYNAHRSY